MKASFAILLVFPSFIAAAPIPQAEIIIPVADIWSEPPTDLGKIPDDKRETQALYGETVRIYEAQGSWVRVEVMDQPTFRQHQKWEGYQGWVLRESINRAQHHSNWALSEKPWDIVQEDGIELPLGSNISLSIRSAPLPKLYPPSGVEILKTATLMIGVPYLWGGLTPGNPPPSPTPSPPKGGEEIKYGLDCSGLVHLAYRVNGITIPRDAHEQWMKAKSIKRSELKPGDLIFSAKAENPKTITHVAIYSGHGQIIEAPQTGLPVRNISFKEKYGEALEKVESGNHVGTRYVYFGSYLH
jgi:hypothetical protein